MESNSICDVLGPEEREVIQEAIQHRLKYYESKLRNYAGPPSSDAIDKYQQKIYLLENALQVWMEEAIY